MEQFLIGLVIAAMIGLAVWQRHRRLRELGRLGRRGRGAGGSRPPRQSGDDPGGGGD
jgi:hypothetical protein